ncbi:MAG: isopenicillin synthase family oxygenase, partial [Microbacteriaceae bacterium]|nr:isopenicillin synthase family oxygenase [Microbacteriaceae bacterium]
RVPGASGMTGYVPIIDMQGDPAAVGAELDDVCTNVGFFQVIGHGIPDAVADRAWDATVALFDLPLEQRLAVRQPSPGYPYGYIPFTGESLAASTGAESKPDLKEAFSIGPVDPPGGVDMAVDQAWAWQPNLWPVDLPELQQAWTDYFRVMLGLGSRLMSLFAQGLSLPADYFAASIDRSPSALRAIRYPARQEGPEDGQLRAGAHTDYGTLTILKQDRVGGLQVLTQQDDWAGVETVPGAYVVNIGDLMARWTNDRWRSTLHRVVDPAPSLTGQIPRRHSMPFFHNANWDALVEVLPTCVPAGEHAKYESVLAGPHLQSKFTKATSA